MASDEIKLKAKEWIQSKCPQEIELFGVRHKVTNVHREADFIDGYTQGRADALKAISVKELMDGLTDSERQQIISKYCECGSKDLRCQCWNDE